jgi:NAD(P)-dependent dehydrogenase (short-subunit alcohol dehydrogenase family)
MPAMQTPESRRPLSGRRALVVGASSGIGRASARLLLEDGASVTLAGRTEAKLRETAAALAPAARAGGGSLSWLACDAMRTEDVRRAVAQAEAGERLDVAVAVPGGGMFCPVLAYDEDRFDEEVRGNLRPQYLVLKHAGLAMVRAGGGSIVAISSTAAVMSSPFLSAYCAAKAAVDQLVRVAADELGALGVRVNAVRPGLTRTGTTVPFFEQGEMLGRFLDQQPLPRGGEPEDIARAVRFLAGPESSWVTGQCLTVDAGNTLRRFPDLSDLTRQVVGDAVWNAVRRGDAPA